MPGSVPVLTYVSARDLDGTVGPPHRYTRDQLRSCLLFAGWKPKIACRVVDRVFLLLQERMALCPSDPASVAEWVEEVSAGLWAVTLPRPQLENLVLCGLPHNSRDSTLLPDLRGAMSIAERRMCVTVLLCGTSGTGKSTLASLLAARLGISALLSTDSVRHALRAVSPDPLLLFSSYSCGSLVSCDVSPPADERGAVLRGYKAQCEAVAAGVERVVATTAARRESMVVEGVHMRPSWAARLVARHAAPDHLVLPFLVCISNEDKHIERFAVRTKTMTLRPDANRYVRHLRAIRTIQEHLVRGAAKRCIPVVNNTNVDRSLATLHASVLACLRRRGRGEDGAAPCGKDASPLLAAQLAEFQRCREAAWSGREALDGIRARALQGSGPKGDPRAAGSDSAGPSTSAPQSAGSPTHHAPAPAAGGEAGWDASDAGASSPREGTSASGGSQAGDDWEHDPVRAALIKACAVALLGMAAVRTVPLMASHGVGHTLQLMDAREPFLIKAGLSRLHFLLNLESTHVAALKGGVAPRLLTLLDREGVDPGVALAALQVLLRIAERAEGRKALLEAGAGASLAVFIARVEAGREVMPAPVLRCASEVTIALLCPVRELA